jgi:hypothetical protein
MFGTLALVAATIAALMPLSPELVERWFSLGIYPPMQRAVTSVTNLLPFSVLDCLLVLTIPTSIVAIVRGARASLRGRAAAPIGRAVFSVASAAAVVYLSFLGLWGLNYRRVPLPSRLLLDESSAQTERVITLGLEAVRQLNALHAEAHSLGWSEPAWRSESLTASAVEVQTELTGGTPAVLGRLKGSILGPYFRWTGVDGMVNPFGLEVIENPDLLPFERPFVAAHEWAHLAGFADESEASFIGFLTCVRASVPEQYSGWLYLYWQVAGETDRRSRAQLLESMAPGPKADVEAIIARLRRGELPRLRVASWLVYDRYLKANRIESGVRSYGAVVSLLVRARFDPGWVPVVRRAGLPDPPG